MASSRSGFQAHGRSRASSWALIGPEIMRSSTSVSQAKGYHAVPTNFCSLTAILWKARWLWLRSLRRRSQKDGTTWKRFDRIAAVRLPKPEILHPWPQDRFAVKHLRRKPGAVVPHAEFCAGGAG